MLSLRAYGRTVGRAVLVVVGVLLVVGVLYGVVLGAWFLATGHRHHHEPAPSIVTTTR